MGIQDFIPAIVDELKDTLSRVSNERAEYLADMIMKSEKVFVAGAGRSGLAVKAFCMRLMHMGFDAYAVGETVTPNLTDRDVLIIGSGSGGTGSLVAMANKAKELGARVSLITILEQSPIADLADISLTIPAPTPKVAGDIGLKSIQPMGSLFEQGLLLTLDALILVLMGRMKKDSDTMFTRHANLE